MKQINGQMNIFEYIKSRNDNTHEQFDKNGKRYDNNNDKNGKRYDNNCEVGINTPAEEYYQETGKRTYWQDSQGKKAYWWRDSEPTEKTVPMFGENYYPLEVSPRAKEITRYDRLKILGTYKYNNKECWSECNAFFDGEKVVSIDTPWDIPIPEWKYWRLEEKVYGVDIKGICDDAYCPKCNDELDEHRFMDSEKCPYCGARISWEPWHRKNDAEMEQLFGENWMDRFKKEDKRDGNS